MMTGLYLDKCFSALEKVLTALWLRTFLVPIDDCLVTDTIFIVENLVDSVRYS